MIDLDDLDARVTAALLHRGVEHKNRELWFLCPARPEKTASAAYHTEKRTWYCQGCHAGGGIKDLARLLGIRMDGRMDPIVVAKLAADRALVMAAHAEEKRQAERTLAEYWAHLRAAETLARHGETLARLEAEGVSRMAVEAFGLGWSTYTVDGVGLPALAIPWTVKGETRAVQYRLLSDNPPGGRYRWHKGSRPTLYNVDAVLTPCDDRIIIVEGAKKAMSLWGVGIESICAVANKGGWKPEWSPYFAAFGRVVFALDPDATAEAVAAARSVPGARVARFSCKPDDLLVTTGGDVDALMAIIDAAHAVD